MGKIETTEATVTLEEVCSRFRKLIGNANRVRINHVYASEAYGLDEAKRYFSVVLETVDTQAFETINIEEIYGKTTKVAITFGKMFEGPDSHLNLECVTLDEFKILVEAMIILAHKGHLG